jgi:hypothetical protein
MKNILARVSKGVERFGKGDTLIVRLRIMQSSTLDSLTMERIVVKVIDHVVPPEQFDLI